MCAVSTNPPRAEGWNGGERSFGELHNIPDGPPVLWLLEVARAALMDTAREEI